MPQTAYRTARSDRAGGLTLRLFGPFQAKIGGAPVLGLHERRGEQLLAFLALNHGRILPSTAVAATFWPETGSLDSLRQSLANLRHAVGDEGWRINSVRGSVWLDITGAAVDAAEFDRALARDGDAEDIAALRCAVALYTGPLLQGWDEEWVREERERRRDRYLDALRALAEDAMRGTHGTQGTRDGSGCRPGEAASYLKRYVRLRPTEQRAWSDWMRALALDGERVAAVEVYERYQEYLHRQYKLAPPKEMTDLYHQIREDTLDGGAGGRPARGAADGADGAGAVEDAAPEPVGGALPLTSRCYVERDADARLRAALLRRDSIVLIKGPRQTGKSSLLARGLHHARRAGAATIITDFESLTAADMASMDVLCLRLASSMAAHLDLEVSPEEVWKPLLGPTVNLERFLHRHILSALPTPLVWGLDEVDRVFPAEFASEFFSMLRAWHEKRSFEPAKPWGRLTLAIACATEAHLYIRDLNKSPFNVGTRVAVEDFTSAQVAALNARYGSPLRDADEVERFQDLVGGHPYLVSRGLHEMTQAGADLAALETGAVGQNGPFGDHLRRIGRFLADDEDLRDAALAVAAGRPCAEPSFFRLRSAGVVAGESPDAARPRCRVYGEYVRRHLA